MPNTAPPAAATAQPLCGEPGGTGLAANPLHAVCQSSSPEQRGCPSPAACCSACPVRDIPLTRPSPLHLTIPTHQVNNNFGGGFVSDEDRVALSAIKFASGESAGAKCISSEDGGGDRWLEASMEQLCVPLPPWGLRGGARETIWFNPAEVNAASECHGMAWGMGTGKLLAAWHRWAPVG